jgi:hypothetical protein
MRFSPPLHRPSEEKAAPLITSAVCNTTFVVPLNQGSCNAASVPDYLALGSHVTRVLGETRVKQTFPCLFLLGQKHGALSRGF